MDQQPLAWMAEPWAQHFLLITGCITSWSLWRFSGRPVESLWSISWRMYIMAFLTAGIPWFGGQHPLYVLYWTMMVQSLTSSPEENWVFLIVGIELISIYWFFYLVIFLLIRYLFACPEE